MAQDLSAYDNDPTLYLFTSLTAGSSHVITATSRIETILRANKIPFEGVDTATDELARKLFGRRAGKKKLPVLVREGYVIADIEQIEEWNEFGELKQALGAGSAAAVPPSTATAPATSQSPQSAAAAASTAQPPRSLQSSDPQPSPSSSSAALPPVDPPAAGATEQHRGSSVSAASAEEIKAVEATNAIPEEEEEEEEEEESGDEDERMQGKTDRVVSKEGAGGENTGSKPQEQDAAAGDQAGESVLD